MAAANRLQKIIHIVNPAVENKRNAQGLIDLGTIGYDGREWENNCNRDKQGHREKWYHREHRREWGDQDGQGGQRQGSGNNNKIVSNINISNPYHNFPVDQYTKLPEWFKNMQ